MKVLLITNNTKSNSGWGRYSLGVVNGLKNKDINTTVVQEQENNCTEDRKIYPSKGFINFIRNIFIIKKLSFNFDIIHALDVWPYGVYGYFAVLGTKKKLFLGGVGTYSIIPKIGKNFLKRILMALSYKKANYVFCISEYVKNRILERVNKKEISVVYMGYEKFQEIKKDRFNFFKLKHNLNNNYTPIIITVGQIKDRKGQLDTIMAIFLLKDKYPNILYIIIGSDSDKNYIEKINNYIRLNNLEKNVIILSNIKEDEELFFFYQFSDIFALNSNNDGDHFEGFGLVILEANQLGKPAVGSNNCGIEDAIKDGYNGFLTKQRDSKDIAKKIASILENYDKMSKNSKKWANEFSWSKLTEEYLKFYKLK